MLMHGERSARNEAVQASKPGETTVLSPSVRMSLRRALSGHILHSQCQTTSDWTPQHPAEFLFSCPPSLRTGCPFGSAIARPGGASRDRTDDLKLAKLALYQLSYGPVVQTG